MEDTPFKFEEGATCLCVGGSGSGKTTAILKLLAEKDSVFEKPFEHFYWALPEGSAVPSAVLQHRPPFSIIRGVPQPDEIEPHSFLCIDDLGRQAQTEGTAAIFNVTCAHKKVTCFLIQHNLFLRSPVARDLALSTRYYLILPNKRDVTSFQHLARQLVGPGTAARTLTECYRRATAEPFSYMCVNLTARCPPALKFTSRITPNEEALQVFALPEHIKALLQEPNSDYGEFIEEE